MLWSIGLHQLRAAHERTEKVRAVHAVAIAEEHVVAMPFIDAESASKLSVMVHRPLLRRYDRRCTHRYVFPKNSVVCN